MQQEMNNNVNFALMMKVNELASRYGLEPYDFLAVLRHEMTPNPALGGELDMTGRSMLIYETPPDTPSKLERFKLMLETLGASNETGILVGEDEDLFKALNHALKIAPRARDRG